jgi:hypothetical protein
MEHDAPKQLGPLLRSAPRTQVAVQTFLLAGRWAGGMRKPADRTPARGPPVQKVPRSFFGSSHPNGAAGSLLFTRGGRCAR